MLQDFGFAKSSRSRLVDTIIISDLHLGSEVSLAKDARRMGHPA